MHYNANYIKSLKMHKNMMFKTKLLYGINLFWILTLNVDKRTIASVLLMDRMVVRQSMSYEERK